MKTSCLVLGFALVLPVPLLGQQAAVAPVEEAAIAIPLGTRVGDLPSGYEDGGRRDPFSSLIQPKRAPARADGRPRSGLAAVAVADAQVRGILRNGETRLAIIEAPGNQSFVVRVEDQLFDAAVERIDDDGVVFAEQLGSASAARIRKGLRSPGEEIR